MLGFLRKQLYWQKRFARKKEGNAGQKNKMAEQPSKQVSAGWNYELVSTYMQVPFSFSVFTISKHLKICQRIALESTSLVKSMGFEAGQT